MEEVCTQSLQMLSVDLSQMKGASNFILKYFFQEYVCCPTTE